MAHAEKCPICNGSGVLPLLVSNDSTNAHPQTKVCHGCSGYGWITVQDTIPYVVPYIPFTISPYTVWCGTTTGDSITITTTWHSKSQ
jgi:hypothetical protein